MLARIETWCLQGLTGLAFQGHLPAIMLGNHDLLVGTIASRRHFTTQDMRDVDVRVVDAFVWGGSCEAQRSERL